MAYPWAGEVPKDATQAAAFLTTNPGFDGRGVVVGVLDTGVDPLAPGLSSKTTTGNQKVIGVYDCSGSGDVLMGPWIEASELNGIGGTSLLPRPLVVNPKWVNPSGKWRVGQKRVQDLYPRGLKERVVSERKKEEANGFRVIEAELLSSSTDGTSEADKEDQKVLLAQLRTLEKELGTSSPGPVLDCIVWHDGQRLQAAIHDSLDMSSVEPMTDFAVKYDCRRFSSLDSLTYAVNIYDGGDILSIVADAGAHASHVAGIIAAHHGVNTAGAHSSDGVAPGAQIVSFKIGDTRLGSMETGVGLYRALLHSRALGLDVINMSYGEATAVDNSGFFSALAEELVWKHNVIFIASAGNNGPALSTVGCPGGTTSAVIGVAAAVTSPMITDLYAIDGGSELQSEKNYSWSSVGPCIDGDPGVNIIAPGAAITSVPNWTLARNQMMNGTSMSSPNAAGCFALLVSAAKQSGLPISAVMMRRAVENSARLLPAVLEHGQGRGMIQVQAAWDLYRVYCRDSIKPSFSSKRPFSYGPNPWPALNFAISLNSERFSRGIYLRTIRDCSVKHTFKVAVTPSFPESGKEREGEDEESSCLADSKIAFEVRVKLECSQPWVQCVSHALLVNAEKALSVSVDPTQLPTGLHVAFVDAFDAAHPELGLVFRIPITVVVPVAVERPTLDLGMLQFGATDTSSVRHFLVPPEGCTFVEVTIDDGRDYVNVQGEPESATTTVGAGASNEEGEGEEEDEEDEDEDEDEESPLTRDCFRVVGDVSLPSFSTYQGPQLQPQLPKLKPAAASTDGSKDSAPRMMILHALQLVRGSAYRDNEKRSYVTLTPGSHHTISFPVLGGVPMELFLGRYWSTLGTSFSSASSTVVPIPMKVKLNFSTLVVPQTVMLKWGCRVSDAVKISTTRECFASQEVSVSAKLDTALSTIKPSGFKLQALGERDVMFNGDRVYSLVLEYVIDQDQPSAEVTPTWPALNEHLYESAMFAQLSQIYSFPPQRRLLYTADAWPKNKCKLSKGKYVLRLAVRHTSAAALEALSDLPCVLRINLPKAVSLSFVKQRFHAVVTGNGGVGNRQLAPGASLLFYVKEPSEKDLPKGLTAGDILRGSMTLVKGASSSPSIEVFYACGDQRSPPALPAPVASPATAAATGTATGTAAAATASTPAAAADKEEGKASSPFLSALREPIVKHLKSLVGKPGFIPAMDAALALEGADLGSHLPLLIEAVKHHASLLRAACPYPHTKPSNPLAATEAVEAILKLADRALALVPTNTLLVDLASLAPDKEDKAAVEARKEKETLKGQWVELLAARCGALVVSDCLGGEGAAEGFVAAIKALAQVEDLNQDKHFPLLAHKLQRAGQGKRGALLKRCNDFVNAINEGKSVTFSGIYTEYTPTSDTAVLTFGSGAEPTASGVRELAILARLAAVRGLGWKCVEKAILDWHLASSLPAYEPI